MTFYFVSSLTFILFLLGCASPQKPLIQVEEEPRVIEVNDVMTIPESVSHYSKKVTFRFGPRGKLRLHQNQLLEILGPIQADNNQPIFDLPEQAAVLGFENDQVSPKWWGAQGDGKTDDTAAFSAAALFLQSRGGGTLLIPAGVYRVGGQVPTPKPFLSRKREPRQILSFKNLQAPLIIEGEFGKKVKLQLAPGLKFGSFHPKTGKPFEPHGNFFDYSYANEVGAMIDISKCEEVQIKNLELDGNLKSLVLGGAYGDKGRQLSAIGIRLYNTKKVLIQNVHTHDHGLDGIVLGFVGLTESSPRYPQRIENVISEYNARQGISIVGGNDIIIRNSKFNHTGRKRFHSSPAAGIDLEAEGSIIRNVLLENVEVINNVGVGILADSGDTADILIKNSRVVGTTRHSLWLRKPRIRIEDSHITGTVVNLYSQGTDAFRAKNTQFDDLDYINSKGQNLGAFHTSAVIEQSHLGGQIVFEGSTFIGSKSRPLWIDNGTIENSKVIIKKSDFQPGDFAVLIRNTNLKNVSFHFEPLQPPPRLSRAWYVAAGTCENKFPIKRSQVRIESTVNGISYLAWCRPQGQTGLIFP